MSDFFLSRRRENVLVRRLYGAFVAVIRTTAKEVEISSCITWALVHVTVQEGARVCTFHDECCEDSDS